ncbi:PIN-like domain-containing protein [Geomonas agri]|uniref:PIN-like domain-containing protein n=1 Tax=Geomonas agri TaxID=2873702 RepID=UPI001CD46117|nr:PIN-like domain-containing protein [Geomonas agri]
MRNAVPGYYQPSKNELNDIWKDCRFVFDANVLLNLYNYDKSAKNDFLHLLRSIAERTWIPHQVALEFQRNRLRLLADRKGIFFRAYNAIDSCFNGLSKKLSDIEITKRHPTIKLEKHIKTLETIGEKLRIELQKHEQEQPGVRSSDDIRDVLDEIFEGRVGRVPDQSYLDELYKDGEHRYNNKIPPGFMDRSKDADSDGAEYFYAGLRFERKFGDLLLWKQLLVEAKEKEWNRLIFVTDDAKEDWWQKVDAQGEKIIGPRPELVDEVYRQTSVTLFQMYNSADFMRAANEYLGSKIDESSIEEAGKVAADHLFLQMSHYTNEYQSRWDRLQLKQHLYPIESQALETAWRDAALHFNFVESRTEQNKYKVFHNELRAAGVCHLNIFAVRNSEVVTVKEIQGYDAVNSLVYTNVDVLRGQKFNNDMELQGFLSFITDLPFSLTFL